MGQSASTPGLLPELTRLTSIRSKSGVKRSSSMRNRSSTAGEGSVDVVDAVLDCTANIPDECLALIFQFLAAGDRKTCSLVCKRWLIVEGQSRQRLSLNAKSELSSHISAIFSRFDSITKIALRCDRRSISINDDGILSVSLHCPNLTRLKLRGCREVSDLGIAALARNCKNLRKLSCGSCVFGSKGLNAVFEYCSLLEELSVKRLRGINDNGSEPAELIGLGLASKSLKSICLKELYNGQCFAPLIIGAKNLRTLKLIKCLGDWDRVLESMESSSNALVEVHLERLQVSDRGLSAISNHSNLEILHIVKTPECTNLGVVSVAERCKLLRKVHIDGWRTNRIGDEGLVALGKNCVNLQELVLIGVNPTNLSLEVIASGCRNLERLALCSSETIGDQEISCLAMKCTALKKLCIRSCQISDIGLEALAWGCPNLVKVKVKKCREVSRNIVELLKTRRDLLVVNLDIDEVEPVDTGASDGGGAQEEVFDDPQLVQEEDTPANASATARNSTRLSLWRSKLAFLTGLVKFTELGKDLSPLDDDSVGNHGLDTEASGCFSLELPTFEHSVGYREILGTLEKQLAQARVMLKDQESSMTKSEAKINNIKTSNGDLGTTIKIHQKKLKEIEEEYETLFKQKMKIVIQHLAIANTRTIAENQLKHLLAQHKSLVTTEAESLGDKTEEAITSLRNGDRDEMDKYYEKLIKKITKLIFCFFIQLVMFMTLGVWYIIENLPEAKVIL